jgi:hypothetical protein
MTVECVRDSVKSDRVEMCACRKRETRNARPRQLADSLLTSNLQNFACAETGQGISISQVALDI